MKKFGLIMVLMVVFVVMLFAMSGTALGQGKPLCAVTKTCADEKAPPPPPKAGPPPAPAPAPAPAPL